MSRHGTASVFFFKHSLERNGRNPKIPGRFSFAASGSALVKSDDGFELSGEWQGHVYADAYADEKPARNLDPNVFSDLLPWHLSFCRISDKKRKNLVDGKQLSAVVLPGDIVVFGSIVSTHIVAVDVVLCVSRTPSLPKRGDRLVLQDRFEDLKREVSELRLVDWDDFAESLTYRLNLADAGPNRDHQASNVSPYRVIIGRRWDDPKTVSVSELMQRFLAGRGFNFIPLCRRQASQGHGVVARPDLFCRRFERALRVIGSNVTKLAETDAKRLLKLLIEEADVLVLDPIGPKRSLRPHDASEVPLRGGGG